MTTFSQCDLCSAWKLRDEMTIEHVPWSTLGRFVCTACAQQRDSDAEAWALEGRDNEARAQDRYEHRKTCTFCRRWAREGWRFVGGLAAECERRRKAACAKEA